jgi:hypothetical protein
MVVTSKNPISRIYDFMVQEKFLLGVHHVCFSSLLYQKRPNIRKNQLKYET